MKRTLALIMALLMLLVALVACAENPNDDEAQTTPTPGESNNPANPDNPGNPDNPNVTPGVDDDKYDAQGYLKDDLPADLNFGNKPISIMCWNSEQPEFEVQDQTGDLVGDSIYLRNINTEERLGVTLSFIPVTGDYNHQADWISAANASIQSGGDYDIFAGYSMTGATMAVRGYSRNLMEREYLDFDKPWWPSSLIDKATINGKLYFCSGDISTNMLHFMYAVFFNKQILEINALESPYELVDSGAWTYTKMFEMATNLYVDNNSDGVRDQDDTYGLCTASIHYDAFFTGAGLETIVKDANEQLVISSSFNSEKTIKLLEDIYAFMHEGQDGYNGSTGAVFAKGNTLFTLDRSYMGLLRKDDIDFEYGIVPVPKFDEAQEDYVTCMAFPYTTYEISVACKEPDMAAAVLECLGSEGYRNVTPMLFETSMKYKYSKDDESARMYDIIRDGVSIDVGRLFCTELKDLTWRLFRKIADGTNPPNIWSSQFKGGARVMQGALDEINSALASLSE